MKNVKHAVWEARAINAAACVEELLGDVEDAIQKEEWDVVDAKLRKAQTVLAPCKEGDFWLPII